MFAFASFLPKVSKVKGRGCKLNFGLRMGGGSAQLSLLFPSPPPSDYSIIRSAMNALNSNSKRVETAKLCIKNVNFHECMTVCGPCLISLPKWALQIGLSSLKGLALAPRLLQHFGGQLLVPVLHLINISHRTDCSLLVFHPLIQHLSRQLLVPVLHLTNTGISQRSDSSLLVIRPLLKHIQRSAPCTCPPPNKYITEVRFLLIGHSSPAKAHPKVGSLYLSST